MKRREVRVTLDKGSGVHNTKIFIYKFSKAKLTTYLIVSTLIEKKPPINVVLLSNYSSSLHIFDQVWETKLYSMLFKFRGSKLAKDNVS